MTDNMPDPNKASFDDMKLQVGARLQLMLQHGSQQKIYYSTLIGFVPGEYLLLKVPHEGGLSVPIREGERVVIRVFSGVSVYTFACNVESVLLSPRNYMHLTFPEAIQVIPLRKEIRVRVDLPAVIKHAARPNETESGTAVLSDLSVTGALVAADVQLGEQGEHISIAFSFRIRPTNQEVRMELGATIRNIQRKKADKQKNAPLFTHGIEFNTVDPTDQVMLQNFVYESLIENRQSPLSG